MEWPALGIDLSIDDELQLEPHQNRPEPLIAPASAAIQDPQIDAAFAANLIFQLNRYIYGAEPASSSHAHDAANPTQTEPRVTDTQDAPEPETSSSASVVVSSTRPTTQDNGLEPQTSSIAAPDTYASSPAAPNPSPRIPIVTRWAMEKDWNPAVDIQIMKDHYGERRFYCGPCFAFGSRCSWPPYGPERYIIPCAPCKRYRRGCGEIRMIHIEGWERRKEIENRAKKIRARKRREQETQLEREISQVKQQKGQLEEQNPQVEQKKTQPEQ